MAAIASIDEDLRQQIIDNEHLQLMRIGYFISAGMTALLSLFILVYTFFAFFIISQVARQPGEIGPPAFVGKLIVVFGVGLTLAVVGVAVFQFITAQRLKERRSRVLCMVVAGITCLHVPFGTLLGVCTFVVLSRPTVQRSFREGPN